MNSKQGLLNSATAAHLLLNGGTEANFIEIKHVGILLFDDVVRVWAKVLPTIDSSQIEFRCYLALDNWLCDLTFYPTSGSIRKNTTCLSSAWLIRLNSPPRLLASLRYAMAHPRDSAQKALSLVSKMV